MVKPLCFVLMPFGDKPDPEGGAPINFDTIYNEGIRPGIESAGLEVIRADEEQVGGIIHAPMVERLMLCEFAVADLTTANPNVFYELGVRHAIRPFTTLPIVAGGRRIPFDLGPVRALPYWLGKNNELSEDLARELVENLGNRLIALRDIAAEHPSVDSPVFQLVNGLEPPPLDHLKTDTFREQAKYSEVEKERLRKAREERSVDGLDEIRDKLRPFDGVEIGVLIDLYLSYRALSSWSSMVELYNEFPAVLQRQVLVREQYGFALNRNGQRNEAARVLNELIDERGPSPETLGILGRVHKDLWTEAKEAGQRTEARGHLRNAVQTYVRGFESDIRDAYPGVNAVTLLEIEGSQKSLAKKADLLPVVRYAVLKKMESTEPDYWDHATMMEIAVLQGDYNEAQEHLELGLARAREAFQPETTANNFRLIREARIERQLATDALDSIIEELETKTQSLQGD